MITGASSDPEYECTKAPAKRGAHVFHNDRKYQIRVKIQK